MVSRNVRAQIKVHLGLTPEKTRSELIDDLIQQERELLVKLIERESDQTSKDALQSVLDWLVVFADIMKTRPQMAP